MDPEIIEVVASRDLLHRDHDGAPDLADLVLVARSCISDINGRRPDYAQCEALPSNGRINRYLCLTEPLESVVDSADEAIERTLDLFF
jgi:hypothetical protein